MTIETPEPRSSRESLALPPVIRVVDSHTGGEPTRVIIEHGPDLGSGPLDLRRERFRNEFDHFRRAVILEPRGSDVLVGALPVAPHDPSCSLGVIFFNNAGYLGMCGHGMIGLLVTLAHLGRIQPGEHRVETPVGIVRTVLETRHQATVINVPSYRAAAGVTLQVEGVGPIVGDIAWGGNWFFLVRDCGEQVTWKNLPRLQWLADQIQATLDRQGVTAPGGQRIDHVELFGPAGEVDADSRNFVRCPGGAYDRSPCGTGTSAKLACLAADGALPPGSVWRQASIIGSVFSARYQWSGDRIVPEITGQAFVTGEQLLRFDPDDPFQCGIQP